MKFIENDDTIVALSTPLGRGAISIVRMSGKNARVITNQIFSKSINESDPRRAITGELYSVSDNTLIDQVVITYFKSPNSYTGEDVIEISSHCNPIIVDQIIKEVISLGARMSTPGEFTQRAFFNQKLDLSQAEAVAAIIDANSRQSLTQSLRQLEGKLSDKIKDLRQEIIDTASLIEVNLDFNEDDIQVYEKTEVSQRAKQISGKIKDLIRSYDYGRMLNEGIKLVLLGKPNVGKSSLLNILLDKERAIVSETPGTTRDYIEGQMEIDGMPVQVIDTAGVRDTLDPIENAGVQRAIQHIETSDIVIAMFEAHTNLNRDDFRLINYIEKAQNQAAVIVVINKIDLGMDKETEQQLQDLNLPLVEISVKKEENITRLKQVLKSNLLESSGVEGEEIIVTNARHRNALQNAGDSIDSFLKGIESDVDEVVLAADLRSALDYVGEIIGETTSDDLLNNIFGQFCIGK